MEQIELETSGNDVSETKSSIVPVIVLILFLIAVIGLLLFGYGLGLGVKETLEASKNGAQSSSMSTSQTPGEQIVSGIAVGFASAFGLVISNVVLISGGILSLGGLVISILRTKATFSKKEWKRVFYIVCIVAFSLGVIASIIGFIIIR